MPDRFIESHIRQIPRFAQIPDQHLRHIVDGFQVLRYEPGEMVFRQSEPAQGLYLFVNGRGRLLQATPDGQYHVIGEIGPNQYLNEAALYQPGMESASLEVVATATVLHLPRRALLNIMTHHPEIKNYLPVPVVAEMERVQSKDRAFTAQRDNETILLDTRRHWWSWIRRIWLPSVLLVVLLIASGFLPGVIAIAVAGLGLVTWGLWGIYTFLEWRNDHVVVTNQRVIRIERDILRFETYVSELPLGAVQMVNADIVTSDPFSRIFGYGNVDIRTAGDAGNMRLTIMPDPDAVQELIFSNRGAAAAEHERQHQGQIRAEIDKVLGIHSPQQDQRAERQAVSSRSEIETDLQRGMIWPTAFVDERGNAVFRKHVAFLFRRMAPPVLLLLAAPVLLVLAFTTLEGLATLSIIGAMVLLVVGFIWLYWIDWDWRNDRYVVGDERIQLIRKRPLWLQNEDDVALLESVDNVVSKKKGLLQNLLNYGDVIISLLGGDQGDEKVFKDVPRPQEIQAEITRRQNRMRSRHSEQAENQRREEIAEYLKVYHETVSGQQTPAQPYPPQGGTPHPPPAEDMPSYDQPDAYPQAPQQRPAQPYPPQQPTRQHGYEDEEDDSPRPPSRRTGGMRPPNIPRRRRD